MLVKGILLLGGIRLGAFPSVAVGLMSILGACSAGCLVTERDRVRRGKVGASVGQIRCMIFL